MGDKFEWLFFFKGGRIKEEIHLVLLLCDFFGGKEIFFGI
jgi:hypothetical protein